MQIAIVSDDSEVFAVSVFRVVKDREVSKNNPVDYAQDRGRKLRRNVGVCISIYMCVIRCVFISISVQNLNFRSTCVVS